MTEQVFCRAVKINPTSGDKSHQHLRFDVQVKKIYITGRTLKTKHTEHQTEEENDTQDLRSLVNARKPSCLN